MKRRSRSRKGAWIEIRTKDLENKMRESLP